MGGNVFEGTESLTIDEVKRAKVIIEKLLDDLAFPNHAYVGSAMDGGPCGDIDVAVEVGGTYIDKTRFYLAAQTTLGSENVKKVGNLICVKLGIPALKSFQADFVFCNNLRDTLWLMRGVFRHMLLALLAKDLSERTSEPGYDAKVSIAVPEGLQIAVNKAIILPRITTPADIMSHLGIDRSAKPSDVLDLRGLAAVVARERPEVLERYPEYVSGLKDKRGYVEAIRIVEEARLSLHI